MSNLSEEVYREKYLKYKQKYLTALENMKGGLSNEPFTIKSKVYFCINNTYNRLLKSGRDNGLSANDNCFLERMKIPNMSLVLEDNKLKVVGGKEQNIPNYPFLFGRKFGIMEESNGQKSFLDKTGIKELPFDNEFALMQLKNAEPIIKKILQNINNDDNINEVYFLHITDKQVSFNGVLTYSPFPSVIDYLREPSLFDKKVQSGGGNTIFYFCNKSAADSINTYYFKKSDITEVKINPDCLIDIALDDFNDKQKPIIAYAHLHNNSIYFVKNRNTPKDKYIRYPIPHLGGESKFSTKKTDENVIRTQISNNILVGNILTVFEVRHASKIFIYKLDDGNLSKFNLQENTTQPSPSNITQPSPSEPTSSKEKKGSFFKMPSFLKKDKKPDTSQNIPSQEISSTPTQPVASSTPKRPPPPIPTSSPPKNVDRFPTSESELFED